MKLTLAVSCLSIVSVAQAKPVEIWECQESSFGNWNNILVVATADDGRRSGSIQVAGVTHHAQFQIEGFDRRWDFGSISDPFRYAFVIQPNGSALYYDFGGESKAKARNIMHCRQRGEQ
jgi:hypothetical protein